ncbi:MAG: SMC-Scp complex subunit ScpB [Oscillospiraceae bacterium]|nr:SMC-Scp complex subunit ScpB [Oscillospiraceae bacterium]
MKLNEEMSIVEAVLFASGEPIEISRISSAVGIETELAEKIIRLINDKYEENGSAMQIIRLADSYQLCVREKYIDYVRAAMETKKTAPLSSAAMEVLTIVAYNQPVTKGFVEHIRGTDSSSVVNSLVEKNLLEEAGRLDVPGKPIAYRTTSTFLRCFQLASIDDLPAVPNSDGQVSFDELLVKENEEPPQTASVTTEDV